MSLLDHYEYCCCCHCNDEAQDMTVLAIYSRILTQLINCPPPNWYIIFTLNHARLSIKSASYGHFRTTSYAQSGLGCAIK